MLLERILATPGLARLTKREGLEAVKGRKMRFHITDKAKQRTTKYEWWTPDKVNTEGLLQMDIPEKSQLDDQWLHTVTSVLKQHGVDTKAFGKGNLDQLANQIAKGQS